jgi:hypothetical protein
MAATIVELDRSATYIGCLQTWATSSGIEINSEGMQQHAQELASFLTDLERGGVPIPEAFDRLVERSKALGIVERDNTPQLETIRAQFLKDRPDRPFSPTISRTALQGIKRGYGTGEISDMLIETDRQEERLGREEAVVRAELALARRESQTAARTPETQRETDRTTSQRPAERSDRGGSDVRR